MKEGGGCTNACIYMGTHIVSLYYRTTWWMFMELCRDEVLMAHTCLGFLSDPPWGGSKAGQEGFKDSFKDKWLYLECCHSGSGFGLIFQGVDPGWGKICRGRASLTKSSFRPNVHSNILMHCRKHMHLFESCHSGCLFIWLNCLLLVIRWAIKGPWASSLVWGMTIIGKPKINDGT